MSNFQLFVLCYAVVAAGAVAIALIDAAIYAWFTR